jgi:hypothetical protein
MAGKAKYFSHAASKYHNKSGKKQFDPSCDVIEFS